ncbi:Mitochondrial inner membrane translocase subunit Tim17/Tim22/Tim23/peroxisomal protein PMP24 [Trinorchestia longiramus]|nr:Mitochondrial inner membrane translocase subunit Tim17/Tim22/Tim23/peroxisomal protein PMP24 [Trinorchestia longiramus]
MNVPLTSTPTSSQLSPYLSVDPSYLQNQPEFIPLEGAQPRRGRFELAFSQIGSLVMLGGAMGGVQGLYKGLQETAAAGHTGKIRRTQVLNFVTKRVSGSANTLGTVAVMYSALGCMLYWGRGSKEDSANTLLAGVLNFVTKRVSGSANTLGTVAVMYSALGCMLYWGRGSKEDSANTLLAGSLTGALYQSSGGLRKAGIGGAVGLALAGLFVACTSRDKIRDYNSRY